MRLRLIIAVIGLLGTIAVWFVFRPNLRVAAKANMEANQTAFAEAFSTLTNLAAAHRERSIVISNWPNRTRTSARQRTLEPAGVPQPPEFTNLPAKTVLQNVQHAIRSYGSRFGGNPVGSNREITRSLSGRNPEHANFLKAEAGMRVDSTGKLVDPWGTPYFFHQLSASQMEIHSAGPDKMMWTQDDLVLK